MAGRAGRQRGPDVDLPVTRGQRGITGMPIPHPLDAGVSSVPSFPLSVAVLAELRLGMEAADTLDPVHALLLSVAPYGLVHVAISILSQVHVSNRQGPRDVAVSSNSGGAQSLRVILVRIPSPIDRKSRSEPNGGKAEAGKGDEGHRLSVGSRWIVTRRKLQQRGIPKGSRSEPALAD
ncbi:hypothetical protein R1flu_028509 [Riccia fluitans]|uniref:Uncharacterized protein n=1 Tax=Riccia fluitans TaxID=41844 RepID=A0ABD1XLW0_9MARC